MVDDGLLDCHRLGLGRRAPPALACRRRLEGGAGGEGMVCGEGMFHNVRSADAKTAGPWVGSR